MKQDLFSHFSPSAVRIGLVAAPDSEKQDWTNYVRIGAYGLKGGDALEIVQRAQESGVFGIEVDNDIPGRYESFLDPDEKLKAIHDVAEAAHKVGQPRVRLHCRDRVHHGARRQGAAHAGEGSSRLAAAQDHWRARDLWRRLGVLDSEGRRGRLGQSICDGVAQDLHGARAADCRRRGLTASTSTFRTG